MWKIVLGFAAFAVLSILLLMKGGGGIEVGGEQHGIPVSEPAASAAQH